MTTIDRRALAAALKIVAPAVSRDHAHPALHGVRIVGGPGERLTLTATNLDLTISHNIYADGDQAGVDLLVPAGALTRMVSSMSGETVTLERTDALSVGIRCGRTKANLSTIDPGGWPRFPALHAEAHELTPVQVELIRRVAHAASTDKGRPVLVGVHLDGDTARATDSFRLASVPLDLGDDWAPITIPSHALAAVLGHADDLTIQADANAARLTAGDTTWTTRLVDQEGGYPAFARLIRDESAHHLTVNREALVESVGRALTIDGDTSAVRLGIVDGDLVVTRRGLGDSINDVLDITADSGGTIPDVAMDGRYLVDLLNAATGDEVTLEIEDELKPIVMHDGEWVGLIMPVRIG